MWRSTSITNIINMIIYVQWQNKTKQKHKLELTITKFSKN